MEDRRDFVPERIEVYEEFFSQREDDVHVAALPHQARDLFNESVRLLRLLGHQIDEELLELVEEDNDRRLHLPSQPGKLIRKGATGKAGNPVDLCHRLPCGSRRVLEHADEDRPVAELFEPWPDPRIDERGLASSRLCEQNDEPAHEDIRDERTRLAPTAEEEPFVIDPIRIEELVRGVDGAHGHCPQSGSGRMNFAHFASSFCANLLTSWLMMSTCFCTQNFSQCADGLRWNANDWNIVWRSRGSIRLLKMVRKSQSSRL